MCEIGVGFSFAALWVFRLRRAEAASAVWIPHWHSEPFESEGTRAAKRYVNGNLVEREVPPGGAEGSFLCSLSSRFSGRGGGVGSLPRAWRRVGVPRRCIDATKIVIFASTLLAALPVFRLRRAEAASAVWIPHWHSEPFESEGTRAAKRYVNGNLGFRNLLGARRGLRGQFSVQSE